MCNMCAPEVSNLSLVVVTVSVCVCFFSKMNNRKQKKCHGDSLMCVCLLCMKKTASPRVLNDKYYDLIDNFVVSGLDKCDDRLPKVLCEHCRRTLLRFDKGDFSRTIEVFDFSKLACLKPLTRSKTDCTCHVCDIATANPFNRPKDWCNNTKTKTHTHAHTNVIKLCEYCLSEIGRGKPHVCTTTQRRQNLLNILVDDDYHDKTSEQVISKVLKMKSSCDDTEHITLSQSAGRPLRCVLNPSPTTTPQLKLDQILTIRNNMNLGVNTTINLVKELRFGFRNRKVIQPGVKDALIQENKVVDAMFTFKDVCFNSKEGERVEPAIFCNDIRELVTTCMEKRELEFSKFRFKIGIDGGGGFIKICQNIIVEGEDCSVNRPKKRRLFKDGSEGAAFKDTSVKKLHILAIAPNVPENYGNVAELWNLLDLDPLGDYGDVKVAADLKLCNILVGLQCHASSHPCTWCDVEK